MDPVSVRFDRRSLLAVLAASITAAALPALGDAKLPTTTLRIGSHPLAVEIASSEQQRSVGLMFRKSLPGDAGMLFIFDDPGYYAMWMKNTLIPLSVAFIDREGRILNIADMQPQTLDSHLSNGPALYAIETNLGWFDEHKVHAGDKVTGLPKH